MQTQTLNSVQTPVQQASVETSQTPTETKHRVGYFGMITQPLSYPIHHPAIVTLDTEGGESLYYYLSDEQYTALQHQLDETVLKPSESLFLWLEENARGQLVSWTLLQLPLTLKAFLNLYSTAYHQQDLINLLQFGSQLKTLCLQQFFWSLVQNRLLMKDFISLPASKRHHHSYPGGLLKHSLEVMLLVLKQLELMDNLSPKEKEVTLLAALLHDIGKTQTLSMNGHTHIGRALDHEQLTLFCIAEPLQKLAKQWLAGATALQYLLTWKSNYGFSRYLGSYLIKSADQISTHADLREKAFYQKPDYFNYGRLKAGERDYYFNRVN